MRRSRTLLFALMVALVASFALPMAASAGSSNGDDLNCSDFSSQQDAQATYVEQDGDPDNLDDDNDGSACDDYSYDDEFVEEDVEFVDASVDEYPREGIASGGGSMASGGPSPLPLLLSAGVFALLATGSWALAVRRRPSR